MTRPLTEHERKNASYIGDGAYIISESLGEFRIFTTDGFYVQNEIYLLASAIETALNFTKQEPSQ